MGVKTMEDTFLDMQELSFEMNHLGNSIARTIDTIETISLCEGESFESSTLSAIYAGLPVEYSESQLSIENKDGILKALFASLAKMVIEFFKKGFEILSSLDPVAKYYKVRIESLRAKSRIYSRMSLKDGSSLKLGRLSRHFKAGRLILPAGARLSSEIVRREELLKYVTGDYLSLFINTVTECANVITLNNESVNTTQLKRIITNPQGISSAIGKLSMRQQPKGKFGPGTFATDPYIGDKCFFFVQREVSDDNLSGLVFYGPKFDRAGDDLDHMGGDYSIKSMKPSDCIHTINAIGSLFDTIESISGPSLKRRISAVEDTILKTINSLSNKSLSKEDADIARKVLNYQSSWMRTIFFPVVTDTTYLFRAMIKYAAGSIKSYE